MKKDVNSPNKIDENLNISELSQYLRGRSLGGIRNLCLRRKIPFRKPGGRLLFLKSEIDEWIEKSPGISLKEMKSESKDG
jgi:predicted DNA-binding transcriptional regulator AlpA